jgi:poly-gamma-glutamate synthesis protein (capsule biosynthesis protein)
MAGYAMPGIRRAAVRLAGRAQRTDTDETAMITLAFLGDIMLGRGVNEQIAVQPPGKFWGTVLPVLHNADAVFGNLECAITTHCIPWRRTRKVFHFGADPAAINVLGVAGMDCVSLANNHILDFEEPGLRDTLRLLDEAGIRHAGAGPTLPDAMQPASVEVAGLRVGVLALTDNEPAFAAAPDRPGVWYLPVGDASAVLDPLEDAVRCLREEGADLVVLSLHWGPNMVETPSPGFRRFAHAAAGLGVDLVHGHSAHIFQGVEPIGKSLILYDTGDFLDDYAVDPILRNDWSFIFLVDLEDARPARLRMLPARLSCARTDLATGEEFDLICRRMQARCEPLGTALQRTDEGLELIIAGGAAAGAGRTGQANAAGSR